MRRIVAVLVVLCILAIAGYVAAFYLRTPSPEQVLQRVAAVYSGASDYTAQSTLSIRYNMMGMDMKMGGPMTVRLKRPLQYRVEVDYGGMFGRQEYVCDGKNLYMRLSMMGGMMPMGTKWIRYEVPGELGQAQGLADYQQFGNGIHAVGLIEGLDPLAEIDEISLDAGTPWRPTREYALDISFNDGGTQKLWVSRKTFLIRKSEWEPSMNISESLVERAEELGGNGLPEGMAGGMVEMFGRMAEGMDLSYSEESDDVRLNSGLDDADFAFEPGEGEEIVEFEDMMSEIGKALEKMRERAHPEPGSV